MLSSMQRLVALGLTASLASAGLFDLEERQSNTTCATGLHLMVAPGCHLPCFSHGPDLLSSIIADLEAAFPGTDEYIVPYDNSTQQAHVSTLVMIAEANQYIQSCPYTPMVFLGYSLGGIVNMNTICGGISSSYTANVLAVINYGQETFVYPEAYDQGTCTESAPLYPRGNTDACAPFAASIQDYCDSEDEDCCGTGNGTDAHFTYAQKYDASALAFVQARYANLTAFLSTSSSSSSMSSTAPPSTSTLTSTSSVVVSTTTTVSSGSSSVSTTVSVSGSATVSASVSSTAASSTATTTTTVSSASSTTTKVISSVSGAESMTITFTLYGSTVTATAAVPTYYPSIPLSAVVEQSSAYPSSLYSQYVSGMSSVSASYSAASASAASKSSASSSVSGSASASASGSATATASGSETATASGSAASSSKAASGSSATATASGTGVTTTTATATASSAQTSASVAPYKGAASQLAMPASGAFRFVAKALRTLAACLLI